MRVCQPATVKAHAPGRYIVHQARTVAKQLRAEVVLGGDPAAKAVPTYSTLADQHIDYAKTYQKNPGNTESVIEIIS